LGAKEVTQLQSICSLTEGKSFGGRRVFASEKFVLMNTLVRLVGSLKSNLDRKLINRSVAGYTDLKKEFETSLFGVLHSYQRKEITADVMETMWRSEIKDGWERAYKFGVGSVGNPFGVWDEDRSWLKGAEAEEFGYLGKFVNAIRKDELVMDIERRLQMYAKTLDGVYHHGQVDGSPEYVKIYWVLGNSCKHCSDCLKFAAGSPYNKKTLPTTPRSGDSRCLSNCNCSLRFVYTEEKAKPEPDTYIVKIPKPIVPPKGYRLPSDEERDKLGQMSTEIDRLRELISATKGDRKKESIIARRDLNQKMIAYMEKHKIYYVPGMQVQTQKSKFVESLTKEVWKELLTEMRQGL
jgi:hypothetical protein